MAYKQPDLVGASIGEVRIDDRRSEESIAIGPHGDREIEQDQQAEPRIRQRSEAVQAVEGLPALSSRAILRGEPGSFSRFEPSGLLRPIGEEPPGDEPRITAGIPSSRKSHCQPANPHALFVYSEQGAGDRSVDDPRERGCHHEPRHRPRRSRAGNQ